MAHPDFLLTCIEWTAFKTNPSLAYGLFQRGPEGKPLLHDPGQVTVLGQLAEGASGEFYLNTVEEFDAVRDKVINRILAFHIKCKFERTNDYFVYEVRKTFKGQLLLLVNTADEEISSDISAKFAEARELLARGEKFRLEISFRGPVKRWFPRLFKDKYRDIAVCKGGSITISNQSAPIGWCCFYCLLCCPCWLLSAPCYFCHRKRTRQNLIFKLVEAPVALRMEISPEVVVDIYKDQETNEDTLVLSGDNRPAIEPNAAELSHAVINMLIQNQAST